jgi:cytochrome c oxidase assembly protein subunit 15
VNERPSLLSAAVVTALGAAALMWCVGFLARMPPFVWPGPLLVAGFVGIVILAGRSAAQHTGRGVQAGAAAGLATSCVNLLILGGLLSEASAGHTLPSALTWIPGFLFAGAALGAVGGMLDRSRTSAPHDEAEWTATLARTAAAATLALVFVGGLVTSREAGLAVVDWPNSYGYNMFLYPLARMAGGVYYEHSHRLFGSLVGLTTIILALRILRFDPRAGVRWMAVVAALLVIGQGILGGLRVTGHFTWSDSPDGTRPNLTLAMVHGVTGQLFFAWMVAIAAVTSRTWRERIGARGDPGASADRAISVALIVTLSFQLILGVRVRHLGADVMGHMTFAIVVLAVAVVLGVRMLGRYGDVRTLRKSGGALLGHVSTQLILGIVAYVVIGGRGDAPTPSDAEVWVATAHQTVGALLLANATLLVLWTRRLLSLESLPISASSIEPS